MSNMLTVVCEGHAGSPGRDTPLSLLFPVQVAHKSYHATLNKGQYLRRKYNRFPCSARNK